MEQYINCDIEYNILEHDNECPICMEYMVKETALTTECGHKLCIQCFIILSFKTNSCPLCRQQMHDYSIQVVIHEVTPVINDTIMFSSINSFRNLYNYLKQLYRSNRVIHPIHE